VNIPFRSADWIFSCVLTRLDQIGPSQIGVAPQAKGAMSGDGEYEHAPLDVRDVSRPRALAASDPLLAGTLYSPLPRLYAY
jgi:hypothetical protein